AQVGQHLATVAYAQGEGVRAGEEVGEGLAGLFVEQDRLGPTFAGAQYVTVGEAATGDEPAEVCQINAAAEDVAHVHVDGGEAGAGEGGSHLDLAVDALLAQDGNRRAHAGVDVGCGDIFVDVVAEHGLKAGVLVVGQPLVLLVGAFGVVAQALDLPAGFAPGLLPVGTGARQYVLAGVIEVQLLLGFGLTDHGAAITQAGGGQLAEYGFGIVLAHLDDRTQLLVKQGSRQIAGIVGQHVQVDVDAAVAGKGHFRDGSQQAAVGAVVVGQQQVVLVQALDHGEEGLEVFGVVQIRSLLADAVVHLGQRRAAESVLATAQVDEDQVGVALVDTQLRGQGAADV